jgi:hypothetical protein
VERGADERDECRRECVRVRLDAQSGDPVLDQRSQAAAIDGDDRQAARLSLEQHLPERVGHAREQEQIRARVCPGRSVPASQPRNVA